LTPNAGLFSTEMGVKVQCCKAAVAGLDARGVGQRVSPVSTALHPLKIGFFIAEAQIRGKPIKAVLYFSSH